MKDRETPGTGWVGRASRLSRPADREGAPASVSRAGFRGDAPSRSAGRVAQRDRQVACPTHLFTRRAFTLVEVLAALAFMGLVIPVVISSLLVSNRAGLTAERSTVAVQLAENRLNELLLADAWTTAASRGDFGQEWAGYRWQLDKTVWQPGTMTELTLDVFFNVQGHEQHVRLATLASETAAQTTATQ